LRGWNTQMEISCGVDGESSLAAIRIAACEPILYTLSGQVRSATTTIAIPGAIIEFGGNRGYHVQADNQGSFSVQLTAGQTAIAFSADSFIDATDTVVVTQDRFDFNLILSPVLDSHNWRIVLEWDEAPRDLDSHLIMQTPSGYDDCETWWGASTPGPCNRMYGVVATLDVDSRNSEDPETITLSGVENCGVAPSWFDTWWSNSADCRFIYKVKNYPTGHDGWDVSQAKVTVYNGDHQVGERFVIGNAGGGYGNDLDHGHTSSDGLAVRANGEPADGVVQYTINEIWSVFAINPIAGTVTACTDFMCSP